MIGPLTFKDRLIRPVLPPLATVKTIWYEPESEGVPLSTPAGVNVSPAGSPLVDQE